MYGFLTIYTEIYLLRVIHRPRMYNNRELRLVTQHQSEK